MDFFNKFLYERFLYEIREIVNNELGNARIRYILIIKVQSAFRISFHKEAIRWRL